MNKKPIFLLAALLVLTAPFSASALTAGELAVRVQGSYEKTRDLKAGFTQVSVVKAMNIKKEGSGTLVIKKPGLLRYSYTLPEKQDIIVKGTDLIVYTPGTKQVIKKRLAKAAMDRTPTTFLAGMGRIADSFDVRYPASGEKDAKGRYQLEMVPRGDKMGIESIVLGLDPVTYDIKSFSFTDSSGNTNVITLKDVRLNKGVDEGAFDFAIPKGASLIAE